MAEKRTVRVKCPKCQHIWKDGWSLFNFRRCPKCKHEFKSKR